MEAINKKVERYLILSKQFQKSEKDVFGVEQINNLTINSGYISVGSSISTRSEIPKEPSRAEKIWNQAYKDAKRASDWDEYLQLQKDLTDYYTSINKLNKQ